LADEANFVDSKNMLVLDRIAVAARRHVFAAITAFTPGYFLAFSTSMRKSFPCGMGLRKTFPHNIPGRFTSGPYTASR